MSRHALPRPRWKKGPLVARLKVVPYMHDVRVVQAFEDVDLVHHCVQVVLDQFLRDDPGAQLARVSPSRKLPEGGTHFNATSFFSPPGGDHEALTTLPNPPRPRTSRRTYSLFFLKEAGCGRI